MDGSSERYRLAPPSPFPQTAKASGIRTVYAAANVVTGPLKLIDPWCEPAADWGATLAFRHHLWGSASRSPRQWTHPSAACPYGTTAAFKWSTCGPPRIFCGSSDPKIVLRASPLPEMGQVRCNSLSYPAVCGQDATLPPMPWCLVSMRSRSFRGATSAVYCTYFFK